jgi:hypothetical protein
MVQRRQPKAALLAENRYSSDYVRVSYTPQALGACFVWQATAHTARSPDPVKKYVHSGTRDDRTRHLLRYALPKRCKGRMAWGGEVRMGVVCFPVPAGSKQLPARLAWCPVTCTHTICSKLRLLTGALWEALLHCSPRKQSRDFLPTTLHGKHTPASVVRGPADCHGSLASCYDQPPHW